jgi:hypothetical protein
VGIEPYKTSYRSKRANKPQKPSSELVFKVSRDAWMEMKLKLLIWKQLQFVMFCSIEPVRNQAVR